MKILIILERITKKKQPGFSGIFNMEKQNISIIGVMISRAIFAINKTKHGVQKWRNGNTVINLRTLQNRAVRINNNNIYVSYADPIFKSENIPETADIHKLHYLCVIITIKHCLNHSNRKYKKKKILPLTPEL